MNNELSNNYYNIIIHFIDKNYITSNYNYNNLFNDINVTKLKYI